MNQQDNNKILNDLYQKANHELPPKALDDVILKQAQQSNNQTVSTKQTKKKWHPWLVAASVVLATPMIWLLTQNQQLTSDKIKTPLIQVPESPPPAMAKTTTETVPQESNGIEAESIGASEFTEDNTPTSLQLAPEKPSPAPLPMLDLDDKVEEQTQRSISGRAINHKSLQANKELLMSEFKIKKRTIKPSTMEPLMALEYEQFGRYLEQGKIEAADQLLTEMQERWPEFDFEDMIYRLAAAEAAN